MSSLPFSTEVEVKAVALSGAELVPKAVLAALPQWIRGDGKQREVHLDARYYAVPASKRSGDGGGRWALRARREEGGWVATVKGPDRRRGGVFGRLELNHPLDKPPAVGDVLPLPLLELFSGAQIPLKVWPRPLFESSINRMVCELVSEGSRVELALDRGRVEAAGREEELQELELELMEGDAQVLVEALTELGDRLPLRPGGWSKTQRGLHLLGFLRCPPAPASSASPQELWSTLLDQEEHLRRSRDLDTAGYRVTAARLEESLGAGPLHLTIPETDEGWACPKRAKRQWALWLQLCRSSV